MKRLIFLFSMMISTAVVGQSYTFITYNIRYDNPNDGVNAWGNRKQKVFDLLKKHNPDVFGVQEALHHQLEDLIKALPAYAYVGVGRDDGSTKGEYSALLYRKDKFDVIEQNTFWLSQTPEVPGSKSWDAMLPRVATWARLRDKKKKNEFTVVNTHFDHVGTEARKQSASILKQHIEKFSLNAAAVVMGDFNCIRTEAPYEVMLEKKHVQLFDGAPANPPGTFCNFAVNSMECRPIDYIFYTSQWEPQKYQVITQNDGQNYPSDHLPVLTRLKLRKD